jgi:hypothetical protein
MKPILGYAVTMSVAEMIYRKAQGLPEQAQDELLRTAERLARQYSSTTSSPLTLQEACEMRGKLAAWEEDWNAPGMEVYDGA